MPFAMVMAASAGAGLISAGMQANAIENAAHEQAQATYAGIGEERRQYDLSRADLAPWRDAGKGALAELAGRLGLGTGGSGELLRRFTLEDLENDPVLKSSFGFGLSEGEKAVKRMFGARGMGRSGAAVKAATRFATDYAGSKAGESRARFLQDQDVLYNRLAGVAGTGQTATTATAQLGADSASRVAGMTTSLGNARGAADIATANAWGGAINNLSDSWLAHKVIESRQPKTYTMDYYNTGMTGGPGGGMGGVDPW